MVTSRAARWTAFEAMVSVIEEQTVQPALVRGPNMKW